MKTLLDEAIEALITERVTLATKEKEIDIEYLKNTIEAIKDAPNFIYKTDDYGYSTIIIKNQSELLDELNKIKIDLVERHNAEFKKLHRDFNFKKEMLEDRYKELKEALKLPWYLKFGMAFSGKFNIGGKD